VIVLCIISLCSYALGFVNNAGSNVDQDQYPRFREIAQDHQTGILIVTIVGVILTVVELFGAIIFNFYMVSLKRTLGTGFWVIESAIGEHHDVDYCAI